MILRGRELAHDLSLDVDAVVVGTGAGGSIALRELARAGANAVALEEGGDHKATDMTQREDEMLPELFQDRAGRATDDLAIQVLSGRGVGGSTLHNTNLCKRTPPEILELWAARHRVHGFSERELRPAFEGIERDLSVNRPVELAINENNKVFRKGVTALGYRNGPLMHNRVSCSGSGFCELGCAYDAKRNARKVVIPDAIDHGARVYADVKATRILHDNVRALGVEGRTAHGLRVVVRAKVVVLAGSAIGSAALALASHVPDPFDQLGRHLHLHPGGVVAGVFEAKLRSWRGIPQSWECTEFLDFREGSDRRVWIIPAFAHPAGVATMLPGFGARHMSMMRNYPHLSAVTAMVHDETEGRVSLDRDGRPALRYRMNDGDRRQLARGLREGARILLAAGAREVVIPAIPMRTLRTEADLSQLDDSWVRPHALPLTAVHPMGTMRMGDDPSNAVVACTGEHHQLRALFVVDGSLFPTSIGGPPQISIYAFALHLAPHYVAAARR